MCNRKDKEVFQLDHEVCFDCWMNITTPAV